MNNTEAQQRVDAAIKELEAAKAALKQAQKSDGRVIMKPSEVPVGEYFRYVDKEYALGKICYKFCYEEHVTFAEASRMVSKYHDEKSVYLTDPYGNAIEPCEGLPDDFNLSSAISAIYTDPGFLADAFTWATTKDGMNYWRTQNRLQQISPSAAAKLRGMIHKWNQENGGQG